MPRIALDAFGGDFCPRNEVEGAIEAARGGIEVVLVGDRQALAALLGQYAGTDDLPIELHHAAETITMHDSPSKAVRGKADASMPVCFDLVKSGSVDALVSAGNSGAMLACGLFKYGRIKGVDRPAIMTTVPTAKDMCCMLDMGANVECRALNLVQFAVMGATYARIKQGKAIPTVGVLSNGTEDSKGTELTRAAHRLLGERRSPDFTYTGYVEGKGVFQGDVDVVVTDGFTGNIALKIAEGAITVFGTFLKRAIEESTLSKLGALMMKPAFADVKRLLDPDSYGGAPLLGVNGVAIICHGGSSSHAIANAIAMAAGFVDQGLTPGLIDAIARNRELLDAAREESGNGVMREPQTT